MSMMLQHAVREAFDRMTKLYGREFTSRWEGQDDDAVITQWTRELGGCSLDAIAWALRHLPERAPNAPGFRLLCEKAPRPQQVAMLPKADPVRGPTAAERERMRSLAESIRSGTVFARPSREWAQRLLEQRAHCSTRAALVMAQEVAGRVIPQGVYEPPPMPMSEAGDAWHEPEMF